MRQALIYPVQLRAISLKKKQKKHIAYVKMFFVIFLVTFNCSLKTKVFAELDVP